MICLEEVKERLFDWFSMEMLEHTSQQLIWYLNGQHFIINPP